MKTRKVQRYNIAFIVTKRDIQRIDKIFSDIEKQNLKTIDENYQEEMNDKISKFESENERRPTDDEIQRIMSVPSEFRLADLRHLGRQWKIACSDSTEISTSSVDDVNNFPNTGFRRIQGLEVQTRNHEHLQARFVLESEYGNTIEYTIEGNDDSVLYFSSKFDEFIHGLKAWYSNITRIDDFAVMLCFFAVVAILFIADLSYGLFTQTENSAQLGKVAGALIGSAIFFAPLAIAILFHYTKLFLFPKTLFSLNSGTELSQKYERRRNIIGVGLILSVVGSLIANWIS